MENIELTLDQFRQLGAAQLDFIQSATDTLQFHPISLTVTITNLDNARSKQNYKQKLFVKLTDGNTSIQAFSDINILENIRDNSFVRVICFCQPSIGFDKEKLEIKANIIKITPIEDIDSPQIIDHTSIRLKQLKNKPHRFPMIQNPTVSLVYSNSTEVAADKDFIDTLSHYKNYIQLEKIEVNLSDPSKIKAVIDKIKSDILIIVRGGGDENALKSFDHDLVLQAIANHPSYRIIGVGHAINHNLVNLMGDYSAITPTAAALHLKEQLNENFKYHKNVIELNKTINEKKNEIYGLNKTINELKNSLEQHQINNQKIDHHLVRLSEQQNKNMNIALEQNEKTLKWIKTCIVSMVSLFVICFLMFKN